MKRTLLVLTLLITLVYSCERGNRAAVEGKPAPEFTLQDISGDRISLSDFRGKVVLVEFWATWCPPCRLSVPELQHLQKEFSGKDLVILGISMDNGDDVRERLKEFINEYNVSYRVLIDDGEVSRRYGIVSIPTIFLLDRELRVAKKVMGYYEGLEDSLKKEIEALL